MAGLLAARMLAPRRKIVVLEQAPALPHNHSAVLRFATNRVAEVLGIPFKRVNLIKTVLPWRNSVADALAYSHKVLGVYRSDRSVLLPERWTSQERWIAPENLIEQMAEGVEIKYGSTYSFKPGLNKVISTIPMPALARAMGFPRDLGWSWINGTNIVGRLRKTDAYVSVYVPNPELPFYRVSITGDKIVIEFASSAAYTAEESLAEAMALLGINQEVDDYSVVDQAYGKIAPIDEDERRSFIHWASTEKRIAWQLGRFATWRPRLLLDDLVQDVRKIERWITMPSSKYEQDLHLIKDIK
jgi:hypothetical protein